MPNAVIPKNYADNTDLTQAQLDTAFQYIETFLNTTKLDSSNLQTSGVAATNLASACVDDTKIAASAVTTPKVADAAITTVKIADGNITLAKLASVLQGAFCPTGFIGPFGMTATPAGWLPCDGSAVSRSTYSALYAAIGNAWGVGDGTTTFNVPDLRGRFMRGLDAGSGNDPDAASRTAINTGGNTGNAIGSLQSDQVGPHTHTVGVSSLAPATGTAIAQGQTGPNQNGTFNTGTTGTTESRPKNAYVALFIKT